MQVDYNLLNPVVYDPDPVLPPAEPGDGGDEPPPPPPPPPPLVPATAAPPFSASSFCRCLCSRKKSPCVMSPSASFAAETASASDMADMTDTPLPLLPPPILPLPEDCRETLATPEGRVDKN